MQSHAAQGGRLAARSRASPARTVPRFGWVGRRQTGSFRAGQVSGDRCWIVEQTGRLFVSGGKPQHRVLARTNRPQAGRLVVRQTGRQHVFGGSKRHGQVWRANRQTDRGRVGGNDVSRG